MKLIIDTDPGIDDALAIALACAMTEIDLVALTTVFGNAYVEQCSRNARYILNLLGNDIPVAQGAALPHGATEFTSSSFVHGPEGLGDMANVPEIGTNAEETAAELLVRMAREHKGELVVCAVAPLTNIADAISLDPAFADNINRLVIMGGAFVRPGNVTPFAEANIYHDASAADAVFASGIDITMIGLNATMQTLLTPADFKSMALTSPVAGGFIDEISQFYLEFYRREEGLDGCAMHDALAVLACTSPERFDMLHSGIRVSMEERNHGETLADPTRRPVSVATGVDVVWALATLGENMAALA